MSQELYAEALFGRDAEEFISSDIGRYLIGCADQEIDTALEKLKRVSPWRVRRIRELQNEIWRAESLKQWLTEAVIRGQQALQNLESAED